ncbi:hypothetical protein HN51_053646 [Arachis hypogaea]|uniref:Uncharacterized protein n=1 Tax=Arachis hypogaea TaxID=3818 RepID=A0A6B9V562_ARAHY|nr:uncharacterized protein DS421_19g640550 [Arachis hypogaea]
MAKKGATLAITMLVILASFCSAIDEFHETIGEEPWTTTYYIAANTVQGCMKECKIRFEPNPIKKKHCLQGCIIYECNKLYRRSENKRLQCIGILNAKYIN